MTDKPILFSAPMIRALLDGRKTQTRRVLKSPAMVMKTGEHAAGLNLPIAIGDRLWVREAWYAAHSADDIAPRDMGPDWKICPAVDWNYADWGIKGRLRAGMHMPRWASRITLTVTDVRVQRVQGITEEDAIAEGCQDHPFPGPWWQGYRDEGELGLLYQQAIGDNPPDWMIEPHRMPDSKHLDRSAKDMFRGLWDAINGKRGYGWAENPWVMAVTFDVTKENIDQIGAAE